jgi:hypothetical protein
VHADSHLLCVCNVFLILCVFYTYYNRVLGLSNDPSPGYNIEQLALHVCKLCLTIVVKHTNANMMWL